MLDACPGCKDGWSPHVCSKVLGARGRDMRTAQEKLPKVLIKKGEKAGYFCPLCGSQMYYARKVMELDFGPRYLGCPKEHFMEDFPLQEHHPDSVDKGPGDSWSLSWIK